MPDPIFVPTEGIPAQRGVQYIASEGLTWDGGNWVPAGPEAVTITKQGRATVNEDGQGDGVNIVTDGHYLEASGEFHFKNDVATTIPEVGLVVADSEGRKWVVMPPVPMTNFTATHRPVKSNLTLRFDPKVSEAEGGTDGGYAAAIAAAGA